TKLQRLELFATVRELASRKLRNGDCCSLGAAGPTGNPGRQACSSVDGNRGGWDLMAERRNTRRYDLSLPGIIRVAAEHAAAPLEGKTRDISTRGLYFVFDRDLAAGSELDLMLRVPAAC